MTERPEPITTAPDEALATRQAASSISWDDPHPAGAPARRRITPVLVPVAVVAVILAAGVLLLLPGPTGRAQPDRYDVEQVGQRYRALGATLLADALRCAPLTPAPGSQEAAQCAFGAWSMILTAYDDNDHLVDARRRATAPAADSVRAAARTDDAAAFAMDETAAGTVTVYWDVTDPRPISATVSTTAVTLPELLAFFDERGFAALARPEQPGAAFVSGQLWAFAAPFVEGRGTTCGPIPPNKTFDNAVEEVRCQYPSGVGVDFAQVVGPEEAATYRELFSQEDHLTTPGTLRIGTWTPTGGPEGRTTEYIATSDRVSHLYFDRPDTFCFGLMYGPEGLTQDRLRAFWAGG
jgi:hypothetical protein